MGSYKSPGVYVEEVSSGSKPIEPASSNIAAFIGECMDGPINQALPIANWSQYTRTFGGFDRSPHLATAVYAWFNNGGGMCFVSSVGRPDTDEEEKEEAGKDDKSKAPKPPKKKASKAGLFIGEDRGPGKRTGLHVFNSIGVVSMIAAPGQSDPAIHDALLSHCERLGDRFAILDCPEELETSLDSMYKPRDSTYGAYYFPWVKVFDPISKENKFIPPSGLVAGIYALRDPLI